MKKNNHSELLGVNPNHASKIRENIEHALMRAIASSKCTFLVPHLSEKALKENFHYDGKKKILCFSIFDDHENFDSITDKINNAVKAKSIPKACARTADSHISIDFKITIDPKESKCTFKFCESTT